MKYLFTIVFTCCITGGYCQTAFEVNRVGINNYGSITFYDGTGTKNEIPYSNISGSPFWNEDWKSAELYNKQNVLLGTYKAKLNLATNEIYYKTEDEVLAAEPNIVTTIIFFNKNDRTHKNVFTNTAPYFYEGQEREKYAEVLNTGETQLLKITELELSTKDSLFGTFKRHYFKPLVKYLLYQKNRTYTLKKLNDDAVLEHIETPKAYTQWIIDNRINFKREEDIIRFLNYYNSLQH
ncbi:hypothetical protein BH09BAC2_BH09BAC2_24010 [soil metagenome]